MNLQNLVDYCEWIGLDIFEGCSVPAPFSMQYVKDEIMKRCGLLKPVYGEPEVFQKLTKMWFDANQWNFEHLAKIYNASYSPIENVYESDHYQTKHTGTDKSVDGGKDITSLSGQDSFTHGEVHTLSGSDTFDHGETHTLSGTDTVTDESATEHEVSAFNTSGYQASSKDSNSGDIDTTYGKTDTASGRDTTGYGKTDTASGTDTTAYGKRDTVAFGKTNDFTHGHIETYDRLRHGNIGVTTNDQLILEELSMLEKFNPYDWIAAKFERENFLQIY